MVTAVASRVRGLLQVRRSASNWICTPVIYGSGLTFMPLELNSKQAIALFTLCHLPKASLAQENCIAELENDISLQRLIEFGFQTRS